MNAREPDRRLRIGLDARALAPNPTGIGRYTENLLRHLVDKDADYFLYSPYPVTSCLIGRPNVTVITPKRARARKRRFAGMLWYQFVIPQLLREHQIDVFWGPGHRLPTFLTGSVKKVVTIHDLVFKKAGQTMHPVNRLFEQVFMPLAVRAADQILADSESTKTAVISTWPWTSTKIQVVTNGVSNFESPITTDAFAPANIKAPFILFVGTLEPRKNLPRLIQAFAKIPPAIVGQCKLVIAGRAGWGNEDLSRLIKEHHADNRVIVLGYVTEDRLNALYRECRFVAMPSLYEGFGLPLVEAMVHGKPVLTSNNSSMPEVAGDAGWLVDPFDVESIQTGLARLLESPVYDTLASKAKASAARYSWERSAARLWKVFEQLSSQRSSG